jgi:glutaredoxin 3
MITIYSKPSCTFCDQAKALLESKGTAYNELILDVGQEKDPLKTYVPVSVLKERVPTARTVPQIFNDADYIGGYNELRQFLQAQLLNT